MIVMIKYQGIDWLTMTTRTDDIGFGWYDIYKKYRDEHIKEELKESPYHNGFYGGVRIGSLAWGYSEALGYILVLSGQDANLLFDKLKPGTLRVTRLDLCVDVLLEEAESLAQRNFSALEKTKRLRAKPSLYRGRDGGDTLYVGSRQSQQFGRLYDKGVQAGMAGSGLLWRYEVEFKTPLSGQIYDKIKSDTPNQRAERIRATVKAWFEERRIPVVFNVDNAPLIIMQTEARVTTAQRKLAWLRSQVQPSVQSLIESGYGKDVLHSLLLDQRAIDKIYNKG